MGWKCTVEHPDKNEEYSVTTSVKIGMGKSRITKMDLKMYREKTLSCYTNQESTKMRPFE